MAYTQSATTLERQVFQAPSEMGLPHDQVLLCLRPLYGIPEAGLHWFRTYIDHHLKYLEMTQSLADKCFLYRQEEHGFSVTALQVDDNLGHGTPTVLKDEEKHSSRYVCKPRQIFMKATRSSLTEQSCLCTHGEFWLSFSPKSCGNLSMRK
jgi:hypothetical protein